MSVKFIPSRLAKLVSFPSSTLSGKLILALIIAPVSICAYAIDNINAGETVTVSGNQGAPEEALNFMINGTLHIGAEGGEAGEVSNYSGFIAPAAGSEGRVVVTGEGSQWHNTSFLYVGHTGSGSLLIQDGGLVSNLSSGIIGMNASSAGVAEVTGAGSAWNNAGTLIVGRDGAGTLIVANEGRVNASTVTLGGNAGGSGTLIIGGNTPTAPGTVVANAILTGNGSGEIVFNHGATDYVFDGSLNGGANNEAGAGTGLVGNLTLDARSGTTILNSSHGDFTGTLRAQDNGTLSVNGNMSGANVVLLPGGTLEGNGRVGSTLNGGTISPGSSIGVLRIAGDYHGDGGTLLMESVLGGDDSPADKLFISGSATGDTRVQVVNLGGEGGFTENGIPLIYAARLSAAEAFRLNGDFSTPQGEQAIVHGAYAYTLRTLQYGNGRWWYLTSDLNDPQTPVAPVPMVPTPETPEPGTPTPGVPPLEPGVVTPEVPVFPPVPEGPDENVPQRYHPGAALYEQYPQVLAELNRMPTLLERVGDIDGDRKIGAWGRMEGNYGKTQPAASTTDARRKMNIWKMQTGVDGALVENDKGMLTGGVNFSYGKAHADISAYSGSGDIDTTGYGPGLTLTWYGNSGLYVDGQLQMMFFSSDLYSDTLDESLKSGNKGKGYAGSVETGWRLDAGNGYGITPQAQLVWSRVSVDSFDDAFGSKVSLKDGDSLLARVGVSGDRKAEWQAKDGTKTRTWLHLNLDVIQEMADGTTTDIEEVQFSSRDARTTVAAGVGGTLDWHDGRYAVYGKVGVQSSPHNPSDNYGAGGNVGVRISW